MYIRKRPRNKSIEKRATAAAQQLRNFFLFFSFFLRFFCVHTRVKEGREKKTDWGKKRFDSDLQTNKQKSDGADADPLIIRLFFSLKVISWYPRCIVVVSQNAFFPSFHFSLVFMIIHLFLCISFLFVSSASSLSWPPKNEYDIAIAPTPITTTTATMTITISLFFALLKICLWCSERKKQLDIYNANLWVTPFDQID